MLPIMQKLYELLKIWSLLNDISWTTGPNSNNFTELILMMLSTKLHNWFHSAEQKDCQSSR